MKAKKQEIHVPTHSFPVVSFMSCLLNSPHWRLISDWGQFSRQYCGSNVARFDLSCDFIVLLKGRQNRRPRSDPRHDVMSTRGRNAVFCFVTDRSRTQLSSLGSTNHHLRGLSIDHRFCLHFNNTIKSQARSK